MSARCPASVDGRHCYHSTYSGPWFGLTPPSMRCCHCGASPEQEHGPYLPAPYQGYWKVTVSG